MTASFHASYSMQILKPSCSYSFIFLNGLSCFSPASCLNASLLNFGRSYSHQSVPIDFFVAAYFIDVLSLVQAQSR